LPKKQKKVFRVYFNITLNKIQIQSNMKIQLALSIFAISLFVACGGGQEAPKASENTETATAETSEPGEKEITIKVIGNSMADMAYSPTLINVNKGDLVKLTLVNENDAEGMYHNIIFVKLGSGQEVATEAIAAGKDKDYIPENENIIAASPMAAPKETVNMEFTAPEAGTYNFICTYPGHFPMMIGKMIVK
jgi:azurin